MERAPRFGPMAPSTRANGGRTRRTGGEPSGTQTETFTRANGSMIRLRVKARIRMSMARSTLGLGKMTCRMGLGWKHGMMGVNMKGTIGKA